MATRIQKRGQRGKQNLEAPMVDDDVDFSFFWDIGKKDHCYKNTETIYSIKVYVKT
jgi:hypothetical protein